VSSRKVMAIVLAFVGPWGVGHLHLGHRLRACAWLALATVSLAVLGSLVPVVGVRFGWGTGALAPFAALLFVWFASFVDLLRSTDAGKVALWHTVVFFVAGMAGPVAAALAVRAFVLESYVIPTESMQPTVLAGDHIFVDKRDRAPHYGDVILLVSPERPDQMLVKRVIAMPNDVLEMKSGRPFINGWQVPSCALGSVTVGGATGDLEVEFLGDAAYLVFYDAARPVAQHAGPLYAARDGLLVLGDDRNDSADSRTWHGGIDGNVPVSSVRGHALFVWLRLSTADERRFGIGLRGALLPSSLASVRPQLDRCLASRPASQRPPEPPLLR
jgi:signal peptidase I